MSAKPATTSGFVRDDEITAALDHQREMADRDREWWDDDPTAYDLPMTGATYLRPGERRDLA